MESLKKKIIQTPLGDLTAIADHQVLHHLSFSGFDASPGTTKILSQIEDELSKYFSGKLNAFSTPLSLEGTPFQKRVWNELLNIPFGKTVSYGEIARFIGNPQGSRAVGSAIGKNPFVIIIPCHRVLSKGSLGGYSQGIQRKKWLLEHEMHGEWTYSFRKREERGSF